MWKDLTLIKMSYMCKQWCILGDFNAVKKNNERKRLNSRGNMTKREVEGFNKFIDTMKQVDVPPIEGKYTWYKDNGTIKSGIDRIMIYYWLDIKWYI